MANIAEQLNDLVVTGETDPEFRIMCCMNWKKFRDGEGLGDDLARYAREAFPNRASTEQIAAIQSFPTEPLRLLRQVVILALDCPRDPPERIRLAHRPSHCVFRASNAATTWHRSGSRSLATMR